MVVAFKRPSPASLAPSSVGSDTVVDEAFVAESADLQRRMAYFETVRGLHKSKRTAGIIGCLIGMVVMLWGDYRGPDVLRYVGLGIVIAAWLIFIYTVIARAAYVRKNPLEAGN